MNLKEPDQTRKSPQRAKPKSNPFAYMMTDFLTAQKYNDIPKKLKSFIMSINDTYDYKNPDEERELKEYLNILFDTLTGYELKMMHRRTTN